MKHPENILELAALQPDLMGFIFYEPSKRFMENKIPDLDNSIQKVGVFVNQTIDGVVATALSHQLEVIQLHGEETPDYCSRLKEMNFTIIKVFSVDANFDFSILNAYQNACDYFLFDTKGALPGGNGVAFDWKILKKYSLNIPFFLSGGIGVEEIDTILQMNIPHLYAIDCNSKLETAPGLKNIENCKIAINKIK
jgi:phosphoribosylanthranilate isomerase